jgi:hypothetical protein
MIARRSSRLYGYKFPAQAINAIASYATNFTLTENPISEGGKWSSWGVNPPRTHARTDGTHAFGTMSSFNGTNFPDSGATLSGFSANHQVTAVVFNNIAPSGTEIEIILRANALGNAGYEVDIGPSFGLNIVRLNGVNDSFTIAPSFQDITSNVNMSDSITWVASINGNFINVTSNGIPVVTNLDIRTAFNGGLVINSGNPGMGFWNETGDINNSTKFGWRRYSATDL